MRLYEDGGCCLLCGRNGISDPLDTHHIFGGANRKKSEKLGATARLCHSRCHQFGPKAVHQNAATREALHEYGQRKVMREQGWTIREFAVEFGKNYLDAEDWDLTLDELEAEPEPKQGFFVVLQTAPLPY